MANQLGNYFYISLNNIHETIYIGVPFTISWQFIGAAPLSTDTIYLYVNNTLVFTTQGDSITSYEYTPTSENLEIAIHIDTGIQRDTMVTDDSQILTAETNCPNIALNNISGPIYRGVPFVISWGFQSGTPLSTDTIYLYINDTLAFVTHGKNTTSYEYTPTSKNIRIAIHMDTEIQCNNITPDDNKTLTAQNNTLISDTNYIKSALKKILTKKNISYINNDTISTLMGGFITNGTIPTVSAPQDSNVSAKFYHIAQLLKAHLNTLNIFAQESDGITTLIEKFNLIKLSTNTFTLDASYFNNNKVFVGGSNGQPTYSIENSKLKRYVAQWSRTDSVPIYQNLSESSCFSVTFEKADGKERNGLIIKNNDNPNEFYKIFLTTETSGKKITDCVAILKNHADCEAIAEINAVYRIDDQEITLPNEYTLNIYAVKNEFLFFTLYDDTNSQLLYEYKMPFSFNKYDFETNMGYYGKSDNAGYTNYISNIELSTLEV